MTFTEINSPATGTDNFPGRQSTTQIHPCMGMAGAARPKSLKNPSVGFQLGLCMAVLAVLCVAQVAVLTGVLWAEVATNPTVSF